MEVMAIIPKCPIHRLKLVWDADLGLWVCPKFLEDPKGCYYAIPGDPPAAVQATE